MPLKEYIDAKFNSNQAEFGRHTGVSRQKVNDWIRGGWVVVDNALYSPRKKLPLNKK